MWLWPDVHGQMFWLFMKPNFEWIDLKASPWDRETDRWYCADGAPRCYKSGVSVLATPEKNGRSSVLTFTPSSIIVSSGWSSCLRETCTSDVSLKVTSCVVEHIYLSSLMWSVCNDRWTRGPSKNIMIIVELTDSSKGSKSRRRSAQCFNPYYVPFLITIFKKYFHGKRDLSWLLKPYCNAPVFKSGNP